MRGRVKRGVQRQPLPQILFPEETALAAGFLLGFLVDWVTVRDCFVPSSPKAVNGLVRGFQKSNREGLNVKQGAGEGWENGAKATGTVIPARRHCRIPHLDGSKSSLCKVQTHPLKGTWSSQSQAPPGSSQGELPPSLPWWEGFPPSPPPCKEGTDPAIPVLCWNFLS